MIRFLLLVAIVFVAALGFVWLADRPGNLSLVWQGYEIEMPLMAAIVSLALVVILLTILGAIARAVIGAPRKVGQVLRSRRRERGYQALTRGMIAIGAGDNRAARRAAGESRTLLGQDPLVMLLSAQTAQISGDRDAARQAFEALSEQSQTRVLGLHGLFVEAQREGEHAAALHFAEEAHHVSARIPWAGEALFQYRSRAGDWQGALDALSGNEATGLVEKHRARRLRAVLLTGRARDLEPGSPDQARTAALEANKLAPDLIPAAVLASRLLTRANDIRRACRILEAAWKLSPHPELAAAYAQARHGDSPRDRLKRIEKLAGMRANHVEGTIAVAQSAIEAKDWSLARATLSGQVVADPSERICLLMADIEEGESGDMGRVRVWLARALYAPRDPVWTADGEIFEAWAPVSPVSGTVDAFEWRVVAVPPPPPRAIDLGSSAAVVEIPGATDTALPAPVEAPLPEPHTPAQVMPVVDEEVPSPQTPADVENLKPPPPKSQPVDRQDVGSAAASDKDEAASPTPDDPGPGGGLIDEDRVRFREI